MAGARTAMFLFEVVVENVKLLIENSNRGLVIKSDFANIFSLELKDPKQLHIIMPEPLPLPIMPEKKGKKKAKPKPKKGKKGKKEKVVEPPPEPIIQSGQSVLFPSSAELLIQNMKNCPLELSLWSKEDNLVFIGTTVIPWDPIFIVYLEHIMRCEEPPPVALKDEYNIFEEGKAKLIAKISIQVKLTFLSDKLTTAFRTLSEDPTVRKFLYTGINSKTTSYMCTLKTTDEEFEEICKRRENQFVIDKPRPKIAKITHADYRNAPGANLTFFDEKEFCCLGHADKPPESIYKSPETCPDIDFIIDYVRKIIVSCNDNLRMLTPRATISPRVKATDIDRLCYCRETDWPEGELAKRFRDETQSGPCPLCIDVGKKPAGSRADTFDIANIRGPCGKAECKIARDIRAYIENLVDEDNEVFNIDDLIGPCGSKECTLAVTIQDFIRHEGVFTHGATQEGASTQCACIDKMRDSLMKRESCESLCSKDCESATSGSSICDGKGCPFKKANKIYTVLYFTVEYDFVHTSDRNPDGNESDAKSSISTKSTKSMKSTKSPMSSKHTFCGPVCPSVMEAEKIPCSKSVCLTDMDEINKPKSSSSKCVAPVCPEIHEFPPSPADSDVEIRFNDIYNPCCVKSCETADRIKEFITEGLTKKVTCKKEDKDDPCFCDCVCTFKFSNKTTYCAVCGGYECLGDDMRYQPEYIRPHPCPVYHKLYDRKYIKVQSPWPDDDQEKDTTSVKSFKTRIGDKNKAVKSVTDKKGVAEKKTTDEKYVDKKEAGEEKPKKKEEGGEIEKAKKGEGDVKKVKKPKSSKKGEIVKVPTKKEETRYQYPAVPKNMGWNWNIEDVPGMKFRPNWKPGAANAILVRRYRAQRMGVDSINKKKQRALMQRKKKIEMKPTLIVTKRDGEYTVQMEVFRKFSKERLLFQYPYDEKPPLIYTIGKTAEEKRKIQKQRDRRERRETRRKSRLLQSTFRDRCQEICLKAYNQAMGVLPLPNPNSPDCPCAGKPLHESPPIIDSCSCSDVASTISTSDTDNDEWTIEFTPPSARWDAKAKHPPIFADNETQYNYLDYKVKLLDKSGNQVPRFFKGPDGKQQCSDLGGFWDHNKVWLEINKDGYIGPDERWVPSNFTGPDGIVYASDEGVFTDSSGRLWKIGVDGYVDRDGKWVSNYKKKEPLRSKTKSTPTASTVDAKKGVKTSSPTPSKGKTVKEKKVDSKALVVNIKAKPIIEKKTYAPVTSKGTPPATTKPTKNTENVTKPNADKTKSPVIMSVSTNYASHDKNSVLDRSADAKRKAYMDRKALAKYREIIEELRAYDDIGELMPPPRGPRGQRSTRANRASNTPLSQLSTFTMQGFQSMKKMPSFSVDRSFGFGTTSPTVSPLDSTMVNLEG